MRSGQRAKVRKVRKVTSYEKKKAKMIEKRREEQGQNGKVLVLK